MESGKMTPERVLTLGDKEMLTDSELTAARMLSVRAAQHAKDVRDQVLDGAPAPRETAEAIASGSGSNGPQHARGANPHCAGATSLGHSRAWGRGGVSPRRRGAAGG